MRRILIIENQLLVGAGIHVLLAGEVDMEVIGISAPNSEELAQAINNSEPDVIVLDELSHLTCLSRLFSFLNDLPKLRIVVVGAQGNRVRIYNKQEVLITCASQLANIVRAS